MNYAATTLFLCATASAQPIPNVIPSTNHIVHLATLFQATDADPRVDHCNAYWGPMSGTYSNLTVLTNSGWTNFQGVTGHTFKIGDTNYVACSAVWTNGQESWELSPEQMWITQPILRSNYITFSLPQNLFTRTYTNPENPYTFMWEDSNFNVRVVGSLGTGEQSQVVTNVGRWVGPMRVKWTNM